MTAAAADEPARQVDVLIVGAGPAGLCLAAPLQRRGIQPFVVDRHGIAGSWERMPEGLKLVSPWWTNALEFRDIFFFPPFSKVSAENYSRYLQHFAAREHITVQPGVDVTRVERAPDGSGFLVETSHGGLRARCVVVASGYFASPRPPEPAYVDDGSIPTWHASRMPPVENLLQLARASGDAPVVVLGKRISAGQITQALHEAGCRVAFSSRQPLQFRADGIKGALKDFVYFFYEPLHVTIRPRLQSMSFPVMDGGRIRRLVENADIASLPPIERVTGGIVFAGNQKMAASAIIQATGYLPGLQYLEPLFGNETFIAPPPCDEWQVVGIPGLFLLGMDNRMNYRSRTLRGIRADAPALARRIGEYLRASA